MTTYQKITYPGIAAFVFLCVAVFLGLTGLNYRLHMAAGIATFACALAHAALVVYSRLKK